MLRRLATFGALDLLILGLIFGSISLNGNGLFQGIVIGIGVLLIFYGIILTIRFARKHNRYDLRFANMLQSLSVVFLIVGSIQLIVAILAGDIFLIIQGIFVIWLARNTRKRVSTIRHPRFLEWYNQGSDSPKTLRNEEVYASCPHCSSLLAVIPSLLSPQDRCPNCDRLLVNTTEEE